MGAFVIWWRVMRRSLCLETFVFQCFANDWPCTSIVKATCLPQWTPANTRSLPSIANSLHGESCSQSHHCQLEIFAASLPHNPCVPRANVSADNSPPFAKHFPFDCFFVTILSPAQTKHCRHQTKISSFGASIASASFSSSPSPPQPFYASIPSCDNSQAGNENVRPCLARLSQQGEHASTSNL